MNVAILGAGGGGAAAVVDLFLRGVAVRLWNRRERALDLLRANGGVDYTGVLGEGRAAPDTYTANLSRAVKGADALLVCLPTAAHGDVATAMAREKLNRLPVVLNPGHTGGALAFRQAFVRHGLPPPPIAEFSTLTYVARRPDPISVSITGLAKQVRLAALPGDESAASIARALYSSAFPAGNVLETGLANVNMVLHPPGSVLGAAWIEATAGEYTFYVEGMTDGVGRVLHQLDSERLAVAHAYNAMLPDLFHEMQAIGTIEADADPASGVITAIRSGRANSAIKAPDSLGHRYYHEDFWYGLLPFMVFADIAGVHVPIARSLMTLARTLLAGGSTHVGRTASEMGIKDESKDGLMQIVTGQAVGRA